MKGILDASEAPSAEVAIHDTKLRVPIGSEDARSLSMLSGALVRSGFQPCEPEERDVPLPSEREVTVTFRKVETGQFGSDEENPFDTAETVICIRRWPGQDTFGYKIVRKLRRSSAPEGTLADSNYFREEGSVKTMERVFELAKEDVYDQKPPSIAARIRRAMGSLIGSASRPQN